MDKRKISLPWLVIPLLLAVVAAVLFLRSTTVTVLPAGTFSPSDYGLTEACQDLEESGDAVGYGALYEVTQCSVLHGRRTYYVLPCCVLKTQDIPPAGSAQWSSGIVLLADSAPETLPFACEAVNPQLQIEAGDNTILYGLQSVQASCRDWSETLEFDFVDFRSPVNLKEPLRVTYAAAAKSTGDTSRTAEAAAGWTYTLRLGRKSFPVQQTVTAVYDECSLSTDP